MKIHLLLPFILAIACTSCHGQEKTNIPKDSVHEFFGKISPSGLKAAVDVGIDPYFIQPRDTFSTHAPRCITREVLQDKNGDYWFATWQGIVKYDGKVFTNYTLKEGLIRFHVGCCYADKNGNLWFGTARGGVYRYDHKTFTLFTKKDGLIHNNIDCIFQDASGNIWFGTETGVSRYDGKTFTNFDQDQGLTGGFVNVIMQDKTGKLWFGTTEGLTVYDGKSFTEFKNQAGLSFKTVSLLEDKNGNIWIGRWDGLTRYDGKSFTDFLTNFLTDYIIEDQAGTIWLSHSEPNTHYPDLPRQVLYRYDPAGKGETFTKVMDKYEPNDFQLFGKIADRSGNIWFGTMQGPCRYDGKRFTYFAE